MEVAVAEDQAASLLLSVHCRLIYLPGFFKRVFKWTFAVNNIKTSWIAHIKPN